MKARFYKNVSFGLALSAMPFVGACTQQTSNAPQSLITAAQAEPSPAVATNAVASTNTLTEPTALESASAESAPVATPAPNAGIAPLPPNIKPSTALAEIIKLAQSGVDENVMLTFIGNSGSLFSLGSDEIIYLNDIGVANNVITAMIQRDQSLRQTWNEAAQAQNAAAQATAQVAQAAAPSYVEPPQPEPQPVAAEAAPPQQPANVTYNYFYDSLSPYGTWIDIDGYGRCWQPTVVVVNSGWRPYCDGGRWLYSDSGWYWYSDYSWGWAPFHYGRWLSHPRWGWCWYPGYTWAPAWVSWRYNSGYCGWAALPPAAVYTSGIGFSYYGGNVGVSFGFGLSSSCYSFVPWSGFYGYRPYKHCVPPAHAQQIYQNSTVINNYINGDNNTIINRGVPIDQVRRHTGTEIRQVAIRDAGGVPTQSTRRERLERDGRTLAVHRPNIPQSDGVAAPSARHLRNSGIGHTPVAGAGAAAQLESPRAQGPPRPSAEVRDRASRSQIAGPPLAESPKTAEGRTVVQSSPFISGNTRVTSPTVRSMPANSRSTPRSRDDSPNGLDGNRSKDNSRPATTAPLIVQGGERTGSTPSAPATQRSKTLSVPTTQKPPSSSLVVIGRRDNPAQSRANFNESRSTPVRTETPTRSTTSTGQIAPSDRPSATAPQVQTSRSSRPQPVESLAFSRPAMPSPRQVAPSARTYSAPTPYAPSPRVPSVAPTFSAPPSTPAPSRSMPSYSTQRSAPASSVTVLRSSPTPTPSFSAPRSSPAPSPAPSFSASRSAPSPAPSFTPAPSRAPSTPSPSSGRSDSGRQGSSRRN